MGGGGGSEAKLLILHTHTKKLTYWKKFSNSSNILESFNRACHVLWCWEKYASKPSDRWFVIGLGYYKPAQPHPRRMILANHEHESQLSGLSKHCFSLLVNVSDKKKGTCWCIVREEFKAWPCREVTKWNICLLLCHLLANLYLITTILNDTLPLHSTSYNASVDIRLEVKRWTTNSGEYLLPDRQERD